MSRRGLIIRLLIFVPLFGYFGYGAYKKWRGEQEEQAAQSAREVELKAATKSVTLHDGRSIDIVELTPEQAERLHGIKLPPPEDAKAPAPAPAAPAPAAPAPAAPAGN